MTIELIDHKALAISRLATQFRESVNLIAYIQALLTEADNIESVIQDLCARYNIDTSSGVNLDIIGAIVGQSREFVDAEIFDYFFLEDIDSPGGGPANAKGFGDLNNPSAGGRFIGLGESTIGLRLLTDTEYRKYIRARIIRNNTDCTIESLIEAFKFLFNDDTLVTIVEGSTSYTVTIGRLLNADEKAILTNTDLIPKTAGVGVGYLEYPVEGGFYLVDINNPIGVPGNAKGFGDLNDPSVGGALAQLII